MVPQDSHAAKPLLSTLTIFCTCRQYLHWKCPAGRSNILVFPKRSSPITWTLPAFQAWPTRFSTLWANRPLGFRMSLMSICTPSLGHLWACSRPLQTSLKPLGRTGKSLDACLGTVPFLASYASQDEPGAKPGRLPGSIDHLISTRTDIIFPLLSTFPTSPLIVIGAENGGGFGVEPHPSAGY